MSELRMELFTLLSPGRYLTQIIVNSMWKRHLVVLCQLIVLSGIILMGCGSTADIEESEKQEAVAENTQDEIHNTENGNEVQGDEQEEYVTPARVKVENPSYDYYFKGEKPSNEQTITLHKIDEQANEIIDEEEWFNKNGLEKPGFPYSDGTYTYTTQGKADVAMTDYLLQISEDSSGHLVADLDFSDYLYGEVYDEEYYDFIEQHIIFAKIVDDVLYVATGHNTYASFSPQTAYITAINMDDFSVLWKSEPLVCNSRNFEVVSGAIVCGYGFTQEDDFIYILNANTGEVWEKFPLKTKADYIIRKDDILYVREYDTNVKYEIEYLTASADSAKKKMSEKFDTLLTIDDEPDQEAGAYIDTYVENYEKEYRLPDSHILYRMSVADAAAGNRSYALIKSRDDGKNWYVMSASPFGEACGGSIDFVFINEALGFAALSHNGGDEAVLYVTKNGGKSYNEVQLMDNPEVEIGDALYKPYDYPWMPYVENDDFILLVGQGADGDYNGGDAKQVARFVSIDAGETFVFDGYMEVEQDG